MAEPESSRARFELLSGGQSARPFAARRTIDLDAEAAVLSNLMIDPSLLGEVRSWLAPEHFYSEAHRRIFEAIGELGDSATAIDVIAIASRLRASNRLEQVGGIGYVTEVLNAAPVLSVGHVRAHAKTVRDLWALRQLGALADRTRSRVDNDCAGVEDLLIDARERLDELSRLVSKDEASSRVDAVAQRVFAEMVKAGESPSIGARPTGFDRLDRMIAGLSEELTILGARPGMGKTALATAIAVNCARRGAGALVASLETSETPLFTRILCAEASVHLQRARLGALTPSEWSRFNEAAKSLAALPLWLDTSGPMNVKDLWSRCRRLQLDLTREGRTLELVIVDYLQLLLAPRPRMPRHEVIAENVRALKAMAQQLKCTVLGLAQLNREVERREDKHPGLADLRESGEIEQCARTVLLLYRTDYYRRSDEPKDTLVEVIVAKQNNGPTGMVRLGFDPSSTRFFNLAEGA